MIKSFKFQDWHLGCAEGNLKENFSDDTDALDRVYRVSKTPGVVMHSLFWVGTEDKCLIGILVGTEIFNGMMQVSTILTQAIKKYPVAFTKEVLRILNFYAERVKIRRFQAMIRVGFPDATSWIEALGFKREALLEKYGPTGDDYYLYARIT